MVICTKDVQNNESEHITINDDEEIENVNNFVYLGSQITNNQDSTKEIR